MSIPVIAIFRFLPVFGLAGGVSIRRNNRSAMLHIIDVETVIVADGAKPDVFAIVFPVGPGTATLFAFPRDAITDDQPAAGDLVDRCTGHPVAANVNGGGRFQCRKEGRDNLIEPIRIGVDRLFAKRSGAEFACEIVRWIEDQ